ncbi:probable pectate lyase 5 [Impatiens glandulifera]|uniref:probable pectate lyase 5 n=1 Tax=Impatiens glandulifera TaxID=253017 RepID=UPI001FB04BEE|nr:probable pectate lyase 5 [Impatiens glandulifera]
MFPTQCIIIIIIITITILFPILIQSSSSFNLSLPHQHPYPEHVVQDLQNKLNASISRRQIIEQSKITNTNIPDCLTGNPIDDCWRCDPNWSHNRQNLADCGIGFGQSAMGGKNGRIYVVTDSSDKDAANPTPGTLRHAVIQEEPLWIIFSANMLIRLRHELIINSYKTIDGRGAEIVITGGGCLTIQYVNHVIVHGIEIRNCVPTGNTDIRSSPSHVGHRGRSDGDGISIFSSRNIWIDHCSLSRCTDGLIDAIMGSTAITISNCYFSNHDEVMLLGHDDRYFPDSGMQVTIAFNHFGKGLVQRMPRCRFGYIHVVNNDFTEWQMYAIGGSASPTINSQGNRYMAPTDPNAKEVTRRLDADEGKWSNWNWRTDGDILVNGAYFVPSGQEFSTQYAKASSLDPKSVTFIDRLTSGAGVFGGTRDTSASQTYPSYTGSGIDSSPKSHSNNNNGNDQGDFFSLVFGNGGSSKTPTKFITIVFSVVICFSLEITTGGLLKWILL